MSQAGAEAGAALQAALGLGWSLSGEQAEGAAATATTAAAASLPPEKQVVLAVVSGNIRRALQVAGCVITPCM